MTDRSDRFFSRLLTVAAVVIAVAVAKREFFPGARQAGSVAAADRPLLREEAWTKILAASAPQPDPAVKAVLVEFVDLECPACRAFHLGALRTVREEFGDSLGVAYVHWPLSNHRFARPAAEGAECARQQDRFGEFVDAVYTRQDSLGLKSWAAYAREAGVTDSVAFGVCLDTPSAIASRIEAGIDLAQELGLTGTPTILLNGWRFPVPPNTTRLRAAIRAVLDGRNPA